MESKRGIDKGARDVKNCTGSVKFFKALGLTGTPPSPQKRICQTEKGNFRKNICPRLIKNKNSGMSLLNLEFNMTMTPVYEVLLQI